MSADERVSSVDHRDGSSDAQGVPEPATPSSRPAASAAGPTIRLTYLGVPYDVPEGLTIMRALEMVGHMLTHGVGCRAGFCGACSTIYRFSGGNELHVALACQMRAADGMEIFQVPAFPMHRADFDVFSGADPAQEIHRLYPELATCLGCNTCTKSCPVDLDVMGYVGSLLSGDLKRVSELSFDCVSCGLCAFRCPAGITPFTAALHARRAVARSAVRSPDLAQRVAEIQQGVFAEGLEQLKRLDRAELEAAYHARDIKIS